MEMAKRIKALDKEKVSLERIVSHMEVEACPLNERVYSDGQPKKDPNIGKKIKNEE